MTLKQFLMTSCAAIATLSIAPGHSAFAQDSGDGYQFVKIAPTSGPEVQSFVRNPSFETSLTHSQKLALLQQKVRYVFVIFQENRSFDHYFGTYPGANGLFSQPASATPGFVQQIVNTDGSVGTISPFLITPTIMDINGAPYKSILGIPIQSITPTPASTTVWILMRTLWHTTTVTRSTRRS